MINLSIEASILLQGTAERADRTDFPVVLLQTENQFILQVDDRLIVSENYDFDYRGLVDELEELFWLHKGSIDWCEPFEMNDLIEDWEAVDCDCAELSHAVDEYLNKNYGVVWED